MSANTKLAAALHPGTDRSGVTQVLSAADTVAAAVDEHARLAQLVEQIRDRANTGVQECLGANEVTGNAALIAILTLIERSEDGLDR